MKIQLVVLSILATASLATTALAGPVVSAKSPPASVEHTPMTPEQTRALWEAAQTKLKADHLYSGAINGRRDDGTMRALRHFQSRHRLPQTGNLDRDTRQALGI
ncbi:MAG: peptidoglycan-binding domain-containing protein [Terricaulis sp.]